MKISLHRDVAVLLSTYNGAHFICQQIESLAQNVTPFTLHWLDDHSTDETISLVRHAASRAGVHLMEWHQRTRAGLPGSYFRLLELVNADAYLFCDQDDIWQAGKIDATVESLSAHSAKPELVYSDPLLFSEEKSGVFRRQSEQFGGSEALQAMNSAPPLVHPGAPGHTQGLNRILRDILIGHIETARHFACGHDCWMFTIAAMSGSCILRCDIPTALYRQHAGSFVHNIGPHDPLSLRRRWRQFQLYRRLISRHAQGILAAAGALPQGPAYHRLLGFAETLANFAVRQSPLKMIRFLANSPLHLSTSSKAWLLLTCLTSTSNAPDPLQRSDSEPSIVDFQPSAYQCK